MRSNEHKPVSSSASLSMGFCSSFFLHFFHSFRFTWTAKNKRKTTKNQNHFTVETNRNEPIWDFFRLEIVIVVSVVVVITVTARQFISHAPHTERLECCPGGREGEKASRSKYFTATLNWPHVHRRIANVTSSSATAAVAVAPDRTRTRTKNDCVMVNNHEMKNKKQRKTRQQTENYK